MGYYYYGFDMTYLVLVLPAILIALFAQIKVKSAFSKYSKQFTKSGLTGKDAAERILMAGGITNVKVERVSGSLTDHYDPKTNVIRLSDGVYGSNTISAVGVAAHEAGHALQYAEGYAPIKLRAAIIPVTNIGSILTFPLILFGIIFNFTPLMYLGIAAFGLSTFFQLITLPVELNASKRAMGNLRECSILGSEELKGAGSVLSAAAMTYVASLLVSLMQLLRLLIITQRRR